MPVRLAWRPWRRTIIPPESGTNTGCASNPNHIFPRYYILIYCVLPNNPDGSSHCATEHFYFPTPDSNELQCTLTGTHEDYTLVCSTPSDVVAIDKNLGCSSNNHYNPCNVATGNKYQSETDIEGLSALPVFNRNYNSQLGKTFGFGAGWMSAILKHFETMSASSLVIRRPDGKGITFKNTNSAWEPDTDIEMNLVQDAQGYTLTLRDGTRERYDTIGRQVSLITPEGLTTVIGNDAQGRIESMTGPFGHTITLGRNAAGRLSNVTDAAGQAVIYSYDSADSLLTRVDYPDATAKIYHYENTSFPNYLTGISYVDSAGDTTRYATYDYDTNGKAILTQHAQTDNGAPQERFSFIYDFDTQTTVTDAAGTQEVMTFATNLGIKNLTSKVNQADGKTLTQTFDANNNLTCRQDEENRVTLYSYNSTNQRTGMTEGLTGDCTGPVPVAGVTRTTNYQYLSPTLDLPTVITSPSVATGQNKTTTLQYTDASHPNPPTVITQSGFAPAGASVSRTVTLGYNSFGQVNLINGPRTDVVDITTLDYYECTTGGACGQLRRVTNALVMSRPTINTTPTAGCCR